MFPPRHSTHIWQWEKATEHCSGSGIQQQVTKSLTMFLPEPISTPLSFHLKLIQPHYLKTDLCIEWLKCRAWAARWKEEIQLIDEEMRQALEFCLWKVKWWEQQAHHRTTVPSHLWEGLVAYTTQNAAMEHRRLMSWLNAWELVCQRTAQVLENHLKGQKESAELTMLEIEIEADECDK